MRSLYITKLLFSLAKMKKSTQSFLHIFVCKIEKYFEKIYFITFITARMTVPERQCSCRITKGAQAVSDAKRKHSGAMPHMQAKELFYLVKALYLFPLNVN